MLPKLEAFPQALRPSSLRAPSRPGLCGRCPLPLYLSAALQLLLVLVPLLDPVPSPPQPLGQLPVGA